jgi:hypothetical protein
MNLYGVILDLLAFICVLYALMYFIKVASKWHPHEWKIVGASHKHCVIGNWRRLLERVDITEVLHRCNICGAVKVVALEGNWIMDQLVKGENK